MVHNTHLEQEHAGALITALQAVRNIQDRTLRNRPGNSECIASLGTCTTMALGLKTIADAGDVQGDEKVGGVLGGLIRGRWWRLGGRLCGGCGEVWGTCGVSGSVFLSANVLAICWVVVAINHGVSRRQGTVCLS